MAYSFYLHTVFHLYHQIFPKNSSTHCRKRENGRILNLVRRPFCNIFSQNLNRAEWENVASDLLGFRRENFKPWWPPGNFRGIPQNMQRLSWLLIGWISQGMGERRIYSYLRKSVKNQERDIMFRILSSMRWSYNSGKWSRVRSSNTPNIGANKKRHNTYTYIHTCIHTYIHTYIHT